MFWSLMVPLCFLPLSVPENYFKLSLCSFGSYLIQNKVFQEVVVSGSKKLFSLKVALTR